MLLPPKLAQSLLLLLLQRTIMLWRGLPSAVSDMLLLLQPSLPLLPLLRLQLPLAHPLLLLPRPAIPLPLTMLLLLDMPPLPAHACRLRPIAAAAAGDLSHSTL